MISALQLPPTQTGETAPSVIFRPVKIGDYQAGALDITVKGRRVLSVPSQLGCAVGCTFCVSKDTPLVRNLSAAEMLELVRTCFDAEAPDGRAVELSFTGEGEPLVNWKHTTACAEEAARRYAGEITSVRYCFSGIGAGKLLSRARHSHLPVRLQFSLHAARQEIRDRLVPRSMPLPDILHALRAHEAQFSAIELNVVLQDGVNDADEDLEALIAWGDPNWPVILNPLLADGCEVIARVTPRFADALRDAGRDVKVYANIGSLISRQRIYPLMSAVAVSRTNGLASEGKLR